MYPEKIRIKNVGPYKDETISLGHDLGNVVAITGANGSGKSLLLSCIYFALYQKLPDRAGTIYRFCTEKDAGVELEFTSGTDRYKATLVIDSHNRKMEAVLSRNGEALNDGKLTTYAELIPAIVGSADVTLASAYGAQGKEGNFLSLEKRQRKDMIIKMIGMEIWQTLVSRVKESKVERESRRSVMEGRMAATEQTAGQTLPKKEIEDLKEKLEKKRQAKGGQEKAIESAQKALADTQAQISVVESERARMAEEAKRVAGLRGQRDITKGKLAEAEERAAEEAQLEAMLSAQRAGVESVEGQLAEHTARIAGAKTARTKQALLNRKADDALTALNTAKEKAVTVTAVTEAIKQRRAQLMESEQAMESLATAQEQMAAANSEYMQMVQENLTAETNLKTCKSALAMAESELTAAVCQVKDAQEQAEILSTVPCGDKHPDCKFLARAHEAKAKAEEHQRLVDLLQTRKADIRAKIDSLPVPDEHAQQEAKAAIAVLADKITKMKTATETHTKVTNEVRKLENALDDAVRAEAEIPTLQDVYTLAAQEAAETNAVVVELTKLEEDSAALRSKLDNAREDETRTAKRLSMSQAAKETIPGLQEQLETYLQNISSEDIKIETKRHELDTRAKTLANDLMVQSDAVASSAALMTTIQNDIDSIRDEIRDIENAQRLILEARQLLETQRQDMRAIDEELFAHKVIEKDAGPMGIQRYELEAVGPMLARLANDLLYECFGSRFALSFRTQKLTVDGKSYTDEYSIICSDAERGLTLDVSDMSGGEKAIVLEAIGIAIGLWRRNSGSVGWDVLIRDETSGALDVDMAPHYLMLLRKAAKLGGYQRIYFITHQPALIDMADSVLSVSDGRVSQ